MPTLILIRGAQGSGKTTLAKALAKPHMSKGSAYQAPQHFEADAFWYLLGNGDYAFDANLLGRAHQWCQEGVEKAMKKAAYHKKIAQDYRGDIIVSNTFTTKKEMQPYLDLAKRHDYTVQEIICRGQFKNTHGVPADVVKRKRESIEL